MPAFAGAGYGGRGAVAESAFSALTTTEAQIESFPAASTRESKQTTSPPEEPVVGLFVCVPVAAWVFVLSNLSFASEKGYGCVALSDRY